MKFYVFHTEALSKFNFCAYWPAAALTVRKAEIYLHVNFWEVAYDIPWRCVVI